MDIKSGMTRRIDDLGRICLPKEMRRNLGFEIDTKIDINFSGQSIVLTKHHETCVICGNEDVSREINGKSICNLCTEKIRMLSE